MKIEFAGSEDRQELKEIYHVCFPDDSGAFWDFELDCRMKPDNILVCREHGKILSTVQILAEDLLLAGRRYPVQYIYAAATLPSAQGKGLMGSLLKHAHQVARERGQRFSVLITQNDSLFDFYARFGYRDCGRVGYLKQQERGILPGTARLAQPEDIPQMLELYQTQQRACLSVMRTADVLETQRALYEKNVYVYECEGTISAYGFRTGKHMLEVVGPDADALMTAAGVLDGFTIPGPDMELVRNGCVLPLDQAAADLMKQQNIVYLNLMWN